MRSINVLSFLGQAYGAAGSRRLVDLGLTYIDELHECPALDFDVAVSLSDRFGSSLRALLWIFLVCWSSSFWWRLRSVLVLRCRGAGFVGGAAVVPWFPLGRWVGFLAVAVLRRGGVAGCCHGRWLVGCGLTGLGLRRMLTIGGFSVAVMGVVASAVNHGWGAAVVTGVVSTVVVTGVLLLVRRSQRHQDEVPGPRD